MKFYTINKFAEITGYTIGAIRSKIQRGDWLEDVVWKRAPDNRPLIDIDGYNLWVESSTGGNHNE